MDNVTALDKLVRSLSFEVQAVPQDNIVQVTTTSKSAPLNVKIRVRKKEEAGLHHGVITLPPSTSHPHSPEIIRLVNSDQTIMSFNMIMEADFDKPKKKPRKNILGIFKPACFGGQSDENDAEINEETLTQSDGALKRTTLKKNRDERTRDFFGKCKPGGCLDPPFGEDREPYSPANEEEHAVDGKVMMNASMQSAENKPRSSSIFSNKILSWKRKKSNDEALDKNDGMKREKDAKAESVIDLYQSGSLRTSATYSNSVMTYPHTVNSSELRIQENKVRLSDVYIDPSKNSFNEHSGPFFVPGIVPGAPKKIRTEENNAEKNTDKDGKPIEDYQLPQGLGMDGTAKQPRSKDSATDIRQPSTDPRSDISRKTDSDSAPKTDVEKHMVIPMIIPLQKLGAEEEIKDTEVLVTSSDNNLDPGFERIKLYAEQKVDESNIEALLPLDAQQNIKDNTQAKIVLMNKKQYPEDVEAENNERQVNDNGIDHIAPHQYDISQKKIPETTKTKYIENDLDFTDASATIKSTKEADSQFITQNLDVVQTDIVGSEDQSTIISTNKDFTEKIRPVDKSEFAIDNNTENNKVIKPEINSQFEKFNEQISPVDKSEFTIDNNTENNKVIKPEMNSQFEELLALDNDTSQRDNISMPDTPTNELGFKSLSEDTEKSSKVNEGKKPDIDTSGRQLSAYDFTYPDKYITTTGNDDPGIPTPITRDTPLELEVDDLQQIWKNDADSLVSVPVTLHMNKNMHEEDTNVLDKVNETNDEISNVSVPYNGKDTNALNDLTLDNHNENISFSRTEKKENVGQNDSNIIEDASYPRTEMDILKIPQSDGTENKENVGQYDSNSIEDASYPRKETDILEIPQSDGRDIDSTFKPDNNLLGDPLEKINVQKYSATTTDGEDMIEVPVHEKDNDEGESISNVQQKSGDGTPTDQVIDPIKPDEKHIKFIDIIDTEKNYEDTVVSPIESDYLENSKGIFLSNDSDVVLESKENYPESDSYLPPRGRDQKKDMETTADSEKLDVAIADFETKYPYHSISGAQSPATDFPKSFKIDLGIQSYNDNDKVIVKSFDSNTEPQRYPNDIVKIVKCDLKIGNEILVPINSKNDLVVEIKSNKPKTHIIEAVGRLDIGATEKASLGTEFQISPVNRNLVIADDIRKTLLAVYEEELLPLRKSISELKSNMEVFASQQVVPKGRNMFEKRSRPSKIVPPLFKKCGCIRR